MRLPLKNPRQRQSIFQLSVWSAVDLSVWLSLFYTVLYNAVCSYVFFVLYYYVIIYSYIENVHLSHF